LITVHLLKAELVESITVSRRCVHTSCVEFATGSTISRVS